MNRKLKLLAGAAALLLVTGGCQKKATGQVVAVVNGEEITQQQLNAELNGTQIPAAADRKAVMAQVLQRVVERKLLVQQAKADGLDKTPEFLEQSMRAQDGLVLNLLAAKLSKGVALPDDKKIAEFIAANPAMFAQRKRYTLDQIAFPSNADAKTLKDLEATHSLAAIATVLSAHGLQFARGKGQLDTATIPAAMAVRIAALPAGEPFITPNNRNFVASVITDVATVPTPDEQARPAAVNLLRQKALNDAMKARLDKAKADAKIEYQAGFGAPKK